jgi:SNF2 family DNA or RNA helicase
MYCTEKNPIYYEYNGGADCALRMKEIVFQCKVKKSHTPFVFLDKTGTKKLPSPGFLSMFSIVITTNQRFTNEWKNGSFEEEVNRRTTEENPDEYGFRDSLTSSEESCPLLKVGWLRMIVDEGHSMGRGRDNSAICFASWIYAERRWAMTGTPTRQTVSQSGLSNVLHLLRYLQHDFFSRRRDGEVVWQNLIAKGWNSGFLASFHRTYSLLNFLMVRHTKLDIEELPPPHYHTIFLPMSCEEVTTYNTLVCAVQSNLLITSMEGKTSGAQDSLLHRSQAQHAKKALTNIRLVCAGGTRVIPTLSTKFWEEFVDDLSEFNPAEQKMEEVVQYLSRAVTEQLSSCACCGMMLSTLLVFPCGDLVCTECVDNNSSSCVVCEKRFDVDDFQRLQPGMDYQWLHNVEEEKKNRKSNSTPSGPQANESPDDVVVLQGGAGNLAPIDPERRRTRTRKHGDGHVCEYNHKVSNGECTLCWQEHDSCNLVNERLRCEICYRRAELCPTSESKSSYITDRLLRLHEQNQQRGAPVIGLTSSRQARPLKVIVFSQFRKALNMVGDRLLRRFGTACVSEFWGSFRKKELLKFVHTKDCFCMLLGKDGSEGLDLSFCTHIFFVEQVWDKSLENQAVARAWRMGATGSVEVETLIAETSVEETMRELETSLGVRHKGVVKIDSVQGLWSSSESCEGAGTEYQRAKLQFLLKGLHLIKNHYTLSFGTGNKRKASAGDIFFQPSSRKKKANATRVRFQLKDGT